MASEALRAASASRPTAHDPGGDRPHLPTTVEIFTQAYHDLFGKDVQETPTVSYVWMADQLGHFGLGFEITYLMTWIASVAFAFNGWPAALVCGALNLSIWVVKEVFDYRRELRRSRLAKSVFEFNSREIWQNVATALFFIGVGVVVAVLAAYSPLYGLISIPLALIPVFFVLRSWLRVKITFQQAGLPYLYRLTNFPNPIAPDPAEAQALADFIIKMSHPQEKDGRHLVIAGPLGSGASALGIGIGTEFAFRLGIGRYTTLVKLVESSVKQGRSQTVQDFDDGRILWPWATSDLLIVDDVQQVGSLDGRLAALLGRGDSEPTPQQLRAGLEQARLDREFLEGLGRRRSIWVIGPLDGGGDESAALTGDTHRTDGLPAHRLAKAEAWKTTIQELLGCDDDEIRLVALSQTNSEAAKAKVERAIQGFAPPKRERRMLERDLR
jgi:hypothetical protein